MRNFIQRIATIMITAAVVAASVSAASAAPVVYTDEANFNAALAAAGITTGVESFDSLAVGGKLTPFDLGPFTLSNVAPGQPVLAITSSANFVTQGTRAVLTSPGMQPILFTFDTAIRAFAMDVVDAEPTSGGSFLGRIGGAAQQTFFTGGTGQFGRTFLGILDVDQAFTTVLVDADGGLGSFAFDRVQYDLGGASTSVPEPASLTLLGIGLVGAAARLRRRQ
jgi:PEP-CTERM motif